MQDTKLHGFLQDILQHMPADWLKLTTHRLDIYNESLAKTEFLTGLEDVYSNNDVTAHKLKELPTAYDYIRLGHPLSSVLEWAIAKQHNTNADQVISFGSRITPLLAILRKNALDNKPTQICYVNELPSQFRANLIQEVYDYSFQLKKVNNSAEISEFEGSTIFISQDGELHNFDAITNVDFTLNTHPQWGSILMIYGASNASFISEIQHVRRRETIAMTPIHTLAVLQTMVGSTPESTGADVLRNKSQVETYIKQITNTQATPLVASSGLSMQYAIMMGLVHDAREQYPDKTISFIVPPNCYGGTNDQARRVAAVTKNVQILDLPVDGDSDMVQSIDQVLDEVAAQDGIPYIIAEIPTNPRVEVPNLTQLEAALAGERKTPNGHKAIDPVFILDQTFCPNVHFLGEGDILSSVRAISYASGSKFPSGGKCTAGYCLANQKAAGLLDKIALHLDICDNEATALQYEILAEQLPSMNERIRDAYLNTRAFVSFIEKTLPDAKINFVSEELAQQGFTPSVFSLDLPTKGTTEAEREANKRALNHKLIKLMITQIPDESKYCVSYGQLKGCYWTIPATSTQGTTKEGDKDYIARVALSPDMDLELHKKVFEEFVEVI